VGDVVIIRIYQHGSKSVEAVSGSHPDIAFTILKQIQDVIAREPV
jgi:hypothetical protein